MLKIEPNHDTGQTGLSWKDVSRPRTTTLAMLVYQLSDLGMSVVNLSVSVITLGPHRKKSRNFTNSINPFTPEFLKWTLPSLNFDLSTDANRGFCLKSKGGMANSVDPDERARDEPSHLDLHCLHS